MRTIISKQLRERASVKGKQKTWVSKCSDEQLSHLFEKLRAGETARSIAQYAQKVWKLNPESGIHSMSQGIAKFQKRIEDLLKADIPIMTTSHPQNSIEEIPDDLLAMDRIVRMQRERIERMIREEQEKGVRYPNLSRDLQSLAMLSKVLVKEKEFIVKYPDEDPIKKRQNELRNRRIDRNFNTMLNRLGDDGCERLIEMSDKFLQAVSKIAVPMVISKDGNGKLVLQPPISDEE